MPRRACKAIKTHIGTLKTIPKRQKTTRKKGGGQDPVYYFIYRNIYIKISILVVVYIFKCLGHRRIVFGQAFD